ncbi:MAG: ABC transporter ATP-binding protein [Chloroflexi bacterium]|nr:ABC transporter ATP-binding protein [Chloroflexota bacterium]MCL5274193.1 ABC transporter ATP-binding protein [Chloroflexota bacterium]
MSDKPGPKAPEQDIVLRVNDLHTYFYTDLGISRALNGVSFDIPVGKVMGVVGESGCGKSVTALSIMRLLPKSSKIIKGDITYFRRPQHNGSAGASDQIKQKSENGQQGFWIDENAGKVQEIRLNDLDPMGPEMRHIRGAELAMIFQEPMTSLNPVYTIGDQISETIMLHQRVNKAEGLRRAIDILEKVGMSNPKLIVGNYPHQLSGGMRQRAMIAMGLSCHPAVLFADEPTTALDVTTEAQILDLMRDLQAQFGTTIVFITHNLGVVAQMCDSVSVMYLGRIIEQTSVDEIFYNPKHPYTSALLNSIPHIGSRSKERLQPIRGVVPDPYSKIVGCPFHPRCNAFMPGKCDKAMPAQTVISPGHNVRCFLYSDEVEE